ncbi:E1 ubiquitin-activating protein uba2 [Ascosphaera aggregata]|nr:E1 ubiquitin-activating protein uba2 [Ascosphaera aggregata]
MIPHTRNKYNQQSLGSLAKRLKSSKVLLVGAGGIGCELLKNLVLSGFGNINVIDLDTIDLSNLNRQFLFRYEHIKKSKALIAKDVASKFRPGVNIQAHLANIKDPQFSVDWFASFDIVFNALDNLEARRHVNRMCLAADVPLIESGTTGFNGQVQVIRKLAEEIENLRREAQALQAIRSAMGSSDFPQKVFDKVFHSDIKRLRQMEDMWRTKRPPEPLLFSDVASHARNVDASIASKGQRPWSLEENLSVFTDSLTRLSNRYQQQLTGSDPSDAPRPIILFDKDDVDTLDFVSAAANLRSFIFGIPLQSKFNIQQMAGNIIPAIATTNAMTAALCVLQAFKVMKGDYSNAGMLFLERSGARAISCDTVRPPNPNCPVCSTVMVRIGVDPKTATLGDLVEKICREKMGYGEEFSIVAGIGTIYDPDLEDNLPKKLTDFDVVDGGQLTVVDEVEFGEEDSQSEGEGSEQQQQAGPRVNVDFLIQLQPDLPDSNTSNEPIALLQPIPSIPKKPRPALSQAAVKPQPTPTSINPISAAPNKNEPIQIISSSSSSSSSSGPSAAPFQKRKRSIEAISSDIEILDVVDTAEPSSPPAKRREVSILMQDVDTYDEAPGSNDRDHPILLDEESDGAILIDDDDDDNDNDD